MTKAEATSLQPERPDIAKGTGDRHIIDPAEKSSRFDIRQLAGRLPPQADTMLADIYLQDCPDSSARLFRVYKPVPAHFHRTCDEYLYVVSGRGMFWTDKPEHADECAPGQLICFKRETVHAIPTILEEPLVFMAIDAPRRVPTDVIFIEDEAGSPERFMARNASPT